MSIPFRRVRGVRQNMPAGTLVGRNYGTPGAPQILSLNDVAKLSATQGTQMGSAGPQPAMTSAALPSIASGDILSNITGGSAVPIGNTLSATIDFVISNTQGSILYRSASGWVALGPGTSGYFLKTQGAAANPIWAANTAPTAANPTATITTTAVNGSAATFMRSDAAPAAAEASSSTYGICKVDGTTITAASGVLSAVGGATGGAGYGLYAPAMSAVPTGASTGFGSSLTWLNQGSASASNSATGFSITTTQNSASVFLNGVVQAVPSTPYIITALLAQTAEGVNNGGVEFGWYNGSNKLHTVAWEYASGWIAIIIEWNSATSINTGVNPAMNIDTSPTWFQLSDNGTNITFAFSKDGSNFFTILTQAKSAGYLGSSGYTNIFFGIRPNNSPNMIGTIMSWNG